MYTQSTVYDRLKYAHEESGVLVLSSLAEPRGNCPDVLGLEINMTRVLGMKEDRHTYRKAGMEMVHAL